MPGEILPVLLAAAVAPTAIGLGVSAVKMSIRGEDAAQIAKTNREGRRLAAQGTTTEMAERRWGQTAPTRK